jgi:hypothetical protein
VIPPHRPGHLGRSEQVLQLPLGQVVRTIRDVDEHFGLGQPRDLRLDRRSEASAEITPLRLERDPRRFHIHICAGERCQHRQQQIVVRCRIHHWVIVLPVESAPSDRR